MNYTAGGSIISAEISGPPLNACKWYRVNFVKGINISEGSKYFMGGPNISLQGMPLGLVLLFFKKVHTQKKVGSGYMTPMVW